MRIVGASTRVLRLKHLAKLSLAVILVGLGSGTLLCEIATAADRYAPQPWGIDTPAGRCVVCHSLERGGPFRVAPNLWGVMGTQKAWAKDWYAYSPALAKKGGVWTADDLDKFLADANQYLPGTTKSIRVKDPEERRKIIEFLVELRD